MLYTVSMQSGPQVMTNVVIFQYVEGSLTVLLGNPSDNPKDPWRLPSAAVVANQTSLQSLETTLRLTIGLDRDCVTYREQLYTTETQHTDTSLIYINYMYLCRDIRWHKGSQHIGMFPVTKLPPLSKDDRSMIHYAIERLRAKTLYTTIIGALLPSEFDLSQLQLAFETIVDHTTDRRNFRKKYTQLDVLKRVGPAPTRKSQSQRYQFKTTKRLLVYPRPFLS